MSKIVVRGGRRLEGTVRVHGAKNAVLPILAASYSPRKEKASFATFPSSMMS